MSGNTCLSKGYPQSERNALKGKVFEGGKIASSTQSSSCAGNLNELRSKVFECFIGKEHVRETSPAVFTIPVNLSRKKREWTRGCLRQGNGEFHRHRCPMPVLHRPGMTDEKEWEGPLTPAKGMGSFPFGMWKCRVLLTVESVPEPKEIGNWIDVVDLAKQINLEVDSDDVQELQDSHNQELIFDELIEMREQSKTKTFKNLSLQTQFNQKIE
ncbi:hypothetical protein TNCV_1369441 [Trichonephila clavipes]|nr:hypothetical protein TNCV_1369441 [Trichonephila clavipes]